MEPLEDGMYEAIVIDGSDDPDGAATIEVAITTGPHKGLTVTLRKGPGGRNPLDLLGLPATLTVTEGRPRLRLD